MTNTILAIGFILMGFLMPTLFCAGFYFGFSYCENIGLNNGISPEDIPGYKIAEKAKEAANKRTETDAQRQARILAENVENYGTDIAQQEVI